MGLHLNLTDREKVLIELKVASSRYSYIQEGESGDRRPFPRNEDQKQREVG